MQFNGAEFSRLGHTRVTIGNQVFGGRGGGLWSTSILASDLRRALGDVDLLVGLARDVKAGDRVMIASYLGEREFADEQRDAVGQLLITNVVRPNKLEPKKHPGKVEFKILDLFSLGEKPKKVVQDRGAVEAVA